MAKQEKDIVSVTHPEYWETRDKREVYQDACEGTLTLRAKRNRYLPQFPAETNADYDYRTETATCFNLTAKTRNVMTGLVFKEPISLDTDVNIDIQELWENIDNAGTHGDVFCREVFESSFEGYALILVDAPMRVAADREEQIQYGLRPYWIHYTADNIWNWQYRINPINKSKELSLIVLREVSEEAVGQFVSEPVVRFRVFRYDNGLVSWQVYKEELKNDKQSAEYILETEGILPQLSQIPVAIVNQLADEPILLDIALKTIEHFQTYSDYKSLVHKTCVPIPVGKGVELSGADQIIVGGSTMVQTSPDGGFGFAEVSGSSLQLVRQTLQDNREEVALMGLSLLADKTARVDVTATEALLNNIGETSELRVMARNMQDAIELALGHTAEYLNMERTEGGSVELGTAWNAQLDQFSLDLSELNQKAEIANKLDGLVSQQWILEFLGVTDPEKMQEILDQIRAENAVITEQMPDTTALAVDGQTQTDTIDVNQQDVVEN